MKFNVIETTYKEQGNAKCFIDTDCYGKNYYIPRSQIKVVEREEAKSELGVAHLVIEVPNWIINKNNIPVFKLTALKLVR